MADPAEKDPAQSKNEELREQLETAYAFVEGQRATQSFYALTPEECFDRFIERIEGKDTQSRPNVLNRITNVKNNVLAAIKQVKDLPDDAFRDTDPKKDVNTPA